MLKHLKYCNLIKHKKILVEQEKSVHVTTKDTAQLIKQTLSNDLPDDDFSKLFSDVMLANIPYKDANNTVFCDGNPSSPIVLIGEAPGEDEVVKKKPFVGKSGQLLQKMLDGVGLKRESIYVTNVVLWRPPNNRTPLPEEIEEMRPYIKRHVDLIKPKILILVGGIATKCISDKSIAISRLRGEWMQYDACQNAMSIFHPSYLLRSPAHKKETWIDMMRIREKIIELGHANILHDNTLFRC